MAKTGFQPDQLASAKVLDETTWIYYCCCSGCGVGKFGEPLVGSAGSCCCCRSASSCYTGETGACCEGTAVTCCIVEHCSFYHKGAPKCACCGVACGRSEVAGEDKDNVFDYQKVFNETCWIQYFLCGGCGLAQPRSVSPYYCAQLNECCCYHSYCHTEDFCKGGNLCDGAGTCCCIWQQAAFPGNAHSPYIACCGLRMRAKPGQ